jgi:predicted secreted protein
MAKYAGIDCVLKKTISAALVAIAQVRDIKGPGMTSKPIDVSTRDSPGKFMEFIAGMRDGGEVTFDLVFDPDLASHSLSVAGGLGSAFTLGTVDVYTITFSDVVPTVATFSALVIKYEPKAPYNDALTADVTLKVTGLLTYA